MDVWKYDPARRHDLGGTTALVIMHKAFDAWKVVSEHTDIQSLRGFRGECLVKLHSAEFSPCRASLRQL